MDSTQTSLAPALTATVMGVLLAMPPSMSSRPCIAGDGGLCRARSVCSTGEYEGDGHVSTNPARSDLSFTRLIP